MNCKTVINIIRTILFLILICFFITKVSAFEEYSMNEKALTEISENIWIPVKYSMVPQGIAIKDDLILISYYDSKELNNSIIYVINKYGEVQNKCDLNIISHVGGISYDEINNLLWVANENGYISTYQIEDIINNRSAYTQKDFYVGENLIDYKSSNMISSLTFYKDYLYVGNFSLNGKGVMKEYRVNFNQENILQYQDSYQIPNKVQGITFYEQEHKIYILFSISYGRKNNSFIQVSEFNKKIKNYQKSKNFMYELSPMLEQITIRDNLLYALFESNAHIYRNCPNIQESINKISVDELLNSVQILEQ